VSGDINGIRGGEPGPAVEQVDALDGELLRPLVLLDLRDDLVHVRHDLAKGDIADRLQPPLLRLPRTGDAVCDVEQRLARNTPEVPPGSVAPRPGDRNPTVDVRDVGGATASR